MVTKDQISLLSDLELAIALCSTEEDSELFEEFCRRYLKDLETHCLKRCNTFKLDKHVGKQICHESLVRFKDYKSFRISEVNKASGRDGVLVYLCSIATNQFRSYHKKKKEAQNPIPLKTYFDDIFDQANCVTNVEDLHRLRETASEIIKQLTPSERKVVVADVEYKKHTRYLPDEVTERLAEELCVKKSTIRKIRERALKKIKSAFDEINQ